MGKRNVVVFALLITLLSSCNKSLFTKYIDYDNASNYHVINKGGEQYQAVTNIDISWIKGKVSIIKSVDYEYLTVIESTPETYSDKYLCHIYNEQEISKLSIKYCESGISIPSTYSKNLEIHIPDSMAMNSINVYLSTSSLNVSDIAVKELTVKNVSGAVNVSKITSDSVSYDGVSGAFTVVSNEVIENIKINQVSGSSILSFPNDIEGFNVEVVTLSGTFYSDFECIQTENLYSYGEKDKMNVEFNSTSGTLSIVKTEVK